MSASILKYKIELVTSLKMAVATSYLCKNSIKMKKILILFLLWPCLCSAQYVFKTDVDHFWSMRDSVLATPDTAKQLDFVRRLYMNKASDGLKAFLRNKNNPDQKWLALIKATPLFWDSLQMKMPGINAAIQKLEKHIIHFQQLYPSLKPAQIYLLIGLRQQGGTTRGNLALMGVEVLLNGTDMKDDQLVRLGIHEYMHTQQKRPDFQKINVLTSSIREGACDFVSELITKLPVKTPYMDYGSKHEMVVWNLFKKEMYSQNNDNWVSTGNNSDLLAPDLGYFIGYQICKAYYDGSTDKKLALQQIIELDYTDGTAVTSFLKVSDYQQGK
jgi:hypothetical protein